MVSSSSFLLEFLSWLSSVTDWNLEVWAEINPFLLKFLCSWYVSLQLKAKEDKESGTRFLFLLYISGVEDGGWNSSDNVYLRFWNEYLIHSKWYLKSNGVKSNSLIFLSPVLSTAQDRLLQKLDRNYSYYINLWYSVFRVHWMKITN